MVDEIEHIKNLKIDYLINLSGIECKISEKLNYFEFKKISKENVEKIFSLIGNFKRRNEFLINFR